MPGLYQALHTLTSPRGEAGDGARAPHLLSVSSCPPVQGVGKNGSEEPPALLHVMCVAIMGACYVPVPLCYLGNNLAHGRLKKQRRDK